MKGKKILVTGPTGQVAFPLSCALAGDNDVWGAARFSDPSKREALEAAGVNCVAVDLGSGEFGELPDDFDYVLHLAVARASEPDFDEDLRKQRRVRRPADEPPAAARRPSCTARRRASTNRRATTRSSRPTRSATTTA